MPYLVDGNNLLGSWGGRARGDDGRLEVLRRVAAFCRARRARATVVFDGAPLRPDQPHQQIGAVTVRVPPEGRDADSVIREIIDRAARPQEWIVVTSDKPLYSYVRTRGARVLRAHEWNVVAREAAVRGGEGEKPEREEDLQRWLEVFSTPRSTPSADDEH